ncbi:hypothetical protein [Psychromonas sp. Urea-02u-13]|uniref:hypothetical protein n=1 Tax=Psychromonas sp. Urea-02u-13 TaxID=2058326 RepID=UPI000C33DA09|nr:hypothetical protein [Psychromonas sp. Urea-02u-13]PKG38004.1 hypothetical protein CXF74_15970 [Psychromonas sp. Urea-02u-13]
MSNKKKKSKRVNKKNKNVANSPSNSLNLETINQNSLIELSHINETDKFENYFLKKCKNPLFKRYFFNYPEYFSKNIQRHIKRTKYNTLEQDVILLTSHLIKFKNLINIYIEIRDEVEKFILLGDYEEALTCLDRVLILTGYSYWYIQLKFTLLSLLDRDEELLELHRFLYENVNLSYEERDLDVLLESANKRQRTKRNNYLFEAIIEGIPYGNECKALEFMFRFNPVNLDNSDYKAVFEYAYTCNIVDKYNALLRMATTCFAKNDVTNVIYNAVINLTGEIYDNKIKGIVFFHENKNVLTEKDTVFVDVCDTYIKGDFNSVIDKCEVHLAKWPGFSNLYEFYANSLAEVKKDIIFPKGSLLYEIISGMKELILNRSKSSLSNLNRLFQQFNCIDVTLIVKLIELKVDVCRDEKQVYELYRFMDVSGSLNSPFRVDVERKDHLCQMINDPKTHVINYLNVPEYRQLKWKADQYYLDNNYHEAIESYRKIVNAPIHLRDEVTAKIALSIVKLGNIEEASSYIVDLYFLDPKNIWKLPKQLIFDEIDEYDGEKNFYNIDLVITIYLLLKGNYTEYQTISLYLQDYLEQFSISHPSELHPKSFKQLYLLENICDLNVLEGLRYKSENDKVLDRVKVLANLLEYNSETQSIKDEHELLLHEYTKNLCMKKLGKGKLKVDRAKVFVKAKNLYKADFEELISMIEEDGEEETKYTEHSRRDSKEKIFVRTDKKSFNKAASMMMEVRDIYTLDSVFGLDVSLNVDIRHNGIVPFLRSVFEKHDLMCKKLNGLYLDNEFFSDYFKNILNLHYYEIAQDSFKEFSSSIDKLLGRIKVKFIQISTNDLSSDESLFKFTFASDDVNRILDLIKAGSTYEEVINSIISDLDRKANLLIKQGKIVLETVLLAQVNDYFKEIKTVANALGPNAYRINDRIALARTDLIEEVKAVTNWLDFSKSAGEHFPINVPVLEAFNFVEKMFPKVNMKQSLGQKQTMLINGTHLSNFIRVFSILIENAVKRRENTTECSLDINISEIGDESHFVISSNSTGIDMGKVDVINQTVNNINYLDKANRENNSGFYKIKRIFEQELCVKNSIKVNIKGNCFSVLIIFNNSSLIIKE